MRTRYRPCESAPPTPIRPAEIDIAQLAAIQERLMRAASGQFAPSQQGVEHGESNTVTARGSLADPNGERVPGPDLSRRSNLRHLTFDNHAVSPAAKRKPSKKYCRSSRIRQCSA